MGADGYAPGTQREYPYFLGRYCKSFDRVINEHTLRGEGDVGRITTEVERAIAGGGRGEGEFNIYDLRSNLRPAMRAYVRFVTNTFSSPSAIDVPTDQLPKHLQIEVSRLIRDTKLSQEVKELYDRTCQLCGNRLELSPGRFYAEGHHLKPLGDPHGGPDVKENIVCVCPNCHVLLDYGATRIHPAMLQVKPGHSIGQEFIDYHNDRCVCV
jgi:predicted HNH restriction endonuclease